MQRGTCGRGSRGSVDEVSMNIRPRRIIKKAHLAIPATREVLKREDDLFRNNNKSMGIALTI